MLIACDCGHKQFHLRFEPPMNCYAVCADCGEERQIGGASNGGYAEVP